MYCPECHAEYRRGFTHCSDCDIPLVSALAADSAGSMPVGRDVVAFLATDMVEGEAIRGLLEAHGVDAYVVENTLIPGLSRGVTVMVGEEEKELAEEVIAEYESLEREDPEDSRRGRLLNFPNREDLE